jgi:hypothetical protein
VGSYIRLRPSRAGAPGAYGNVFPRTLLAEHIACAMAWLRHLRIDGVDRLVCWEDTYDLGAAHDHALAAPPGKVAT